MIKKYLTLFLVALTTICVAMEEKPTYEREEVPLTAKISSLFSSTAGSVVTTGVVVLKYAPIHENMNGSEFLITGMITGATLFTTSLLYAYVGKNIGKWSDPFLQYFRRHNSIARYVSSKISNFWDVSVYYTSHGYYLYRHLRRSNLQGTIFQDNTVTYEASPR